MIPFECIEAYDFFFTKERYALRMLQQAGLTNVHYLPMYCVPREHHPVALTEDDRRRFEARLSFVGSRYPCAPFVRVHALSEASVKRVLDAGAWGVLAPNVRTREEAELLVRACKYPPRGGRSLGTGRFALSFKTDAPTYFQRANDELLVIAQIEHVDGVKNIDAILTVPGIDACYVGPNDWCARSEERR